MRRLVLALAILSVAGCATKMARVSRALDRYEALLKVEVVPDSTSWVIGQEAHLTLSLLNSSATEPVDACFGPLKSENFHLIAVPVAVREGKGPAGEIRTIDHSGCAERVRLAPGARVSWRQTYVVPDIGVGEAVLHVSVHIVHPRDCEHLYGCYDTMLRAPAVRLSLRRSDASGL